eukprot:Opistho-2@85267
MCCPLHVLLYPQQRYQCASELCVVCLSACLRMSVCEYVCMDVHVCVCMCAVDQRARASVVIVALNFIPTVCLGKNMHCVSTAEVFYLFSQMEQVDINDQADVDEWG